MKKVINKFSAIAEMLSSSINLLVVDDYPEMRNAIVELFTSPLFSVHTASSAKEARDVITRTPLWHSWVLDISLEEKYSGIDLLAEYPNYPFAVVLSGLRSMSVASRAKELGAYKVYDKEPSLLPELHGDLCKLSALSYILNGSGTKYLELFSLLGQKAMNSADAWATSACMTIRQLERICSIHSHLTPRFILPLYYTIELLLQEEHPHDPAEHTIEQITASKHHIEFVNRHLDLILGQSTQGESPANVTKRSHCTENRQ